MAQPSSQHASFNYVPRVLNAGFAGIVGVTCVFPIDLVKTRLQNQRIGPNGELQYKGILITSKFKLTDDNAFKLIYFSVDCAKQTWKSGGSSLFSRVRAMYSGSAVNIVLITPEKAIKLVANDFFRYHLAVPGQKRLSVFRGMIAGGLAGLLQMVVTTPMELLKIQLQDQGRTGARGDKKMTALGLAGKIVREHGITGLYKGLNSTIARDLTFSVIYFPLFAYLDALGPRKKDGSGDAVFWTSFCAGLASGAFSAFVVTPFDVVKTRIQTIKKGQHDMVYTGIPDAFINILRTEGPRALLKGAGCRVMVIAPLFGIAQMVYYIGVAEKVLGIKKAAHV